MKDPDPDPGDPKSPDPTGSRSGSGSGSATLHATQVSKDSIDDLPSTPWCQHSTKTPCIMYMAGRQVYTLYMAGSIHLYKAGRQAVLPLESVGRYKGGGEGGRDSVARTLAVNQKHP